MGVDILNLSSGDLGVGEGALHRFDGRSAVRGCQDFAVLYRFVRSQSAGGYVDGRVAEFTVGTPLGPGGMMRYPPRPPGNLVAMISGISCIEMGIEAAK